MTNCVVLASVVDADDGRGVGVDDVTSGVVDVVDGVDGASDVVSFFSTTLPTTSITKDFAKDSMLSAEGVASPFSRGVVLLELEDDEEDTPRGDGFGGCCDFCNKQGN